MNDVTLDEVLADCQIDLDLEHDLQGQELPCPYRRKRLPDRSRVRPDRFTPVHSPEGDHT